MNLRISLYAHIADKMILIRMIVFMAYQKMISMSIIVIHVKKTSSFQDVKGLVLQPGKKRKMMSEGTIAFIYYTGGFLCGIFVSLVIFKRGGRG